MSAIGQVIPMPVADRLPVQAPARVINLQPDSRKVWGHRLYRMPPPSAQAGLSYGADAGLSQESPTGRLIDIYA